MRVINLCQQPQPPTNCEEQIKSASDDVDVANRTLRAARLQLDNDIKQQSAANKALNDTQTAFDQAVSKKTADISKCIDDIQKAATAKDAAAEAYDDATQKCPGSCPSPPSPPSKRQLLLL